MREIIIIKMQDNHHSKIPIKLVESRIYPAGSHTSYREPEVKYLQSPLIVQN